MMLPTTTKSIFRTAVQVVALIGLIVAWSACKTGVQSTADTQAIEQPVSTNVALSTAPRRVYYVRLNPGPEVLATGAPWMPFLRRLQIMDWNDDRTELTFDLDRMARHIETIMPQIVETGYLMLDLESGPRAKQVGILDEWAEGVNEAIRVAGELAPPGTIVGSYPSPSHVRPFLEDSFRALDYSTGLFFPIHTMGGNRLEQFAQRIAESPYHDLSVVVYLWQFMDPPAGTPPASEPSLWSAQRGGEWITETEVVQRVRGALELFPDVQIAVRGKGAQAARAVRLAQELAE